MDADKHLTWTDCGRPLIITVKQQDLHAEKGFTNEPMSCPDCHTNKDHQRCRDCNILMGPGHVESRIAERCGSCLRARKANAA